MGGVEVSAATYQARVEVYANTYSEAIEQLGQYMEKLWENGNWELVSCEAEPHLRDSAGRILSWQWDFRVSWLGLVKR
jgi:hypothetical protein